MRGAAVIVKTGEAEMKSKIAFYIGAVVLFFFFLREYEAIPIEEQLDSTTCGIYGENLEPYATDTFDKSGGILEGHAYGNKVNVLVERVYTAMCRDQGTFPRYRVEVQFNGRIVFALSHTDIPFAVNTYYKNVKYRIICVNNL